MTLHPVDTEEQRRDLAALNRRHLARRWPPGKLQVCERLDELYPGWLFNWLPKNTTPGYEHPPGYAAQWRGHDTLAGGDQLHPGPEDHARRRPRVFGKTVAALEERIYAMQRRIWSESALWRRRPQDETLDDIDAAVDSIPDEEVTSRLGDVLARARVAAAREWRDEERLSAPAIPTPRCYGIVDPEDGTCGYIGPHGEHPLDVEPPRPRRSAEA